LTNFNVLHDPWIPVRGIDGQPRMLGILETLERAHEIRSIEDASPLVVSSLHRLLLAFLYRAFKPTGVSHVVRLLEEGKFDRARLELYLEKIPSERFDLFGSAPFYQVGDLEFERDTSIAKLAVERSSGNNKALFDHSVDLQPLSLDIAEAIRWLVAHQSFCLGGGKSSGNLKNFTDAPSPRGAQVFISGENLHETLCRNFVPYPDELEESDYAIWEIAPITHTSLLSGQSRALHKFEFAKLFTWQSRAVKFIQDEDHFSRVFYASGWSDVGSLRDPMCAYSPSVSLGGNPLVVKFSLEKSFWRDFDSLFPPEDEYRPQVILLSEAINEKLDLDSFLKILVMGQVTRKDAAVDNWKVEEFPLPNHLFGDKTFPQIITSATRIADEVGQSVSESSKVLARYLLGFDQKRLNKKQQSQIDLLLQSFPLLREYWSNLEAHFRLFLTKLGEKVSPDTVLDWWSDQVLLTVEEAMRTTRKALGFRAFEIKAFLEAESKLALELHKLNLLERYRNLHKEVKA
jgi:CRISPR system Cascade subunit CasA